MTQKTIKIFIDEFHSTPLKKNYAINKTGVYYIDNIWSLARLNLKD